MRKWYSEIEQIIEITIKGNVIQYTYFILKTTKIILHVDAANAHCIGSTASSRSLSLPLDDCNAQRDPNKQAIDDLPILHDLVRFGLVWFWSVSLRLGSCDKEIIVCVPWIFPFLAFMQPYEIRISRWMSK